MILAYHYYTSYQSSVTCHCLDRDEEVMISIDKVLVSFD